MKLFAFFTGVALAQDFDFSSLSADEVFGSGDSELAQLADAYEPAPIALGRSFGGATAELAGRNLPPGINIFDFLDSNGQFDLEAFKEELKI